MAAALLLGAAVAFWLIPEGPVRQLAVIQYALFAMLFAILAVRRRVLDWPFMAVPLVVSAVGFWLMRGAPRRSVEFSGEVEALTWVREARVGLACLALSALVLFVGLAESFIRKRRAG